MKVKCINNYELGKYLTVGKIYDTTKNGIEYYEIIDDNNDNTRCKKERFIPISKIRNETIDKLLEDES